MNLDGTQPGRGRVLIVDDQPTNIRAAYMAFADEHEVFIATSGEQALALCARVPLDLILLDIVMPGMDGLTLCRLLKERPETVNVPVIFITANQGADDEDACWDAGAVDFVTKPVNPRTLRKRVNVHLTLKFQADRLRALAFVDGLTGVANRRQLDERLPLELQRCQRAQEGLGLLLIDVDHFKRFNDRYGHGAGDDCLRRIAEVLRDSLYRPGDLVARYGGEEFACVLPEINAEGAGVVAARMVEHVRSLAIPHDCSDAASVVTISVGGALALPGTPPGSSTIAALLAAADAELYRAKHTGRNRACIGRRSITSARAPSGSDHS